MNNQELTSYRREQFSRAAHHYNSVATIQKSMAGRLISSLKKLTLAHGHVMELGAGTGLCSELLGSFFADKKIAMNYTDFSFDMLKELHQNEHIHIDPSCKVHIIAIDAQKIAAKNLALLISNAMVQWIPDLTAHLTQCEKSLVSGGYYLCSGFGSQNLYPLYDFLDQLGIKNERRPYHTFEAIEDSAANAGLKLLEYHEWSESESFDSVFALLSQIKKLGAGGSASQVFLGRKGLKKLEEMWPRKTDGSILSFWQPWVAVLQK